MKILTISGVDGSGKSTQIQMLKKHLESQGEKVYYFHGVDFSIATKISEFKEKYCLICKITGKCQSKTAQRKSVTKANSLQIILRKIFLHIDIWRFKNLARKLKKEGYSHILSDRFFQDAVINIQYLNLKFSPFGEGRAREGFEKLAKSLESPLVPLSQRGKLKISSFYLQAEPYLIMQRERKPDQGLDYLKDKKMIYDAFADTWNLKVIDGNQPKEKVFDEIINSLK